MSDEWRPNISASEIGDYLYCNHQWWLKRIEGVRPLAESVQRMEEGTHFHDEHWQDVRKVIRNEKVLYAIGALIITMMILLLLLTF
jgi:hypothetical protein